MKISSWLAERLDATPEPLKIRLEAAIDSIEDGVDAVEGLMMAATRTLDSVHDSIDERKAAFDLLAADGLLTLACEAAALADPERLDELCRGMGPSGMLGEVAARWAVRS